MKIPPVKIHFPESDRAEILAQIAETLETGQLTMGARGRAFEAAFAALCGTEHAVAVNSGTSAIEIAMRVRGVEGRTVLVPTNTFFATVLAVTHAGGKVRFVDADPATFAVSLKTIEDQITDDTAAVVVVHIGGIVTPDMPAIRELCRARGLFLFEDAAHAHGSRLGGAAAGSFGDAAGFSFYPTKVITAGEGGMITTNDEAMRDAARLFRDQGKLSFTQNLHDKLGYNWRMSEPHAIIGHAHLKRLAAFIEERQQIAARYDAHLAAIDGISVLTIPDGCSCNYYKYIALLDDGIDRAAVKQRLRETHGVACGGEVYELPCHLQPIFGDAYRAGMFPVAEDLCRRHVCLPMFQGMTGDQIDHVAESLATVLAERAPDA